MASQEVLHIDSHEVDAALDFAGAVEVLRGTLANGFDPETDGLRTRSELRGGEFLFMPSQVGEYAGVKVLTATPDNPQRGEPLIQGTCLLLDGTTHRTLATIDGVALTNLRTPAVSLAGVLPFAQARNPEGLSMVIFGNGVQAVPHIRAAHQNLPITRTSVIVRAPGRGDQVVKDAHAHGIEVDQIVAGSSQATGALQEAGLVVTATSASEPLFDASLISDSACVVAMGSHSPDARELPGELLGRATVLVESLATAKAECGDVIQAVDEGHLTWEDVRTWAHSLDVDAVPSDAPVVFKSAGMSWEDIAVAAAIYEAVKGQRG